MFNAKSRVVIKDNRIVKSTAPQSKNNRVANANVETAYAPTGFGGLGGQRNSISMSAIGAGISKNLDSFLEGFVDYRNEVSMRNLYRDMYYYDAICGGAADMTSTLPFSDFSLVGLDDDKLEKYHESICQLNMKTAFPEFSLGYLVDGLYLGTMVYNPSSKVFTDILPHDVQASSLEDMPFLSQDPLITIKQSEAVRNFLNSSDEVITKQRSNYPKKLLEVLSASEYTLDPLTTIYLPRKGVNGERLSYFKRALPWFLLEKMLYRGTLAEFSKRQRAALHVQVGNDMWEPTPEELVSIVNLIQQADFDPLGPTIATRDGVQLSEFRQGGDFFKITDIMDSTNQLKLRALTISETFLSAEANYATAETSLSVYIENIRTYREYLTQQVFYRKMFPVIAHVNAFEKEKEPNKEQAYSLGFKINNTSKYAIPQVRWHKSLHPHSDRDTMELLNSLQERGVPVTLRMWAAAGGVDIDTIMNELPQDKKLREKIKGLVGEDSEPGTEDDEDSAGFAFAGMKPIKKVGFLNRDYGNESEIVGRTVTGKKKYIYNQRDANKKANEYIVKALANLSDKNHYQSVKKKIEARLGKNRSMI